MKLAEARAMDEQGKLARKVLTEEGWYIPRYTAATAPLPSAAASPPPRILPPKRTRKTKEK